MMLVEDYCLSLKLILLKFLKFLGLQLMRIGTEILFIREYSTHTVATEYYYNLILLGEVKKETDK
jgi:hypothetical protein